jgi:hypothetical protein
MANTDLTVSVNDKEKFSLSNGSYYKLETESDSISFITSLNNSGIKGLRLTKGNTFYIQAEMLGPNNVELKSQTEFSGKPAIERIDVDKLSTESSNLTTIKVNTVEPLPQAKEDAPVIYLFRPFNVAGVSVIARVTDGKNVYEMKNNSSTVITATAGEIFIRTINEGKNISNTSLKLNLEKGKVYYVAVLRSGGALVLTETKMEYAKQEMKL